jgi:hypothetical protein
MSESVIGNDVPRLSSPPTTACIASEILVFAICGLLLLESSYGETATWRRAEASSAIPHPARTAFATVSILTLK